jgi:hypothetical protein
MIAVFVQEFLDLLPAQWHFISPVNVANGRHGLSAAGAHHPPYSGMRAPLIVADSSAHTYSKVAVISSGLVQLAFVAAGLGWRSPATSQPGPNRRRLQQ